MRSRSGSKPKIRRGGGEAKEAEERARKQAEERPKKKPE